MFAVLAARADQLVSGKAQSLSSPSSVCRLLPADADYVSEMLVDPESIGAEGGETYQRRVALVIGNSRYASVAPLKNPDNDAGAMAKLLTGLGFTVFLGTDLDAEAMDACVSAFEADLDQEAADLSLFFYAGHGVQLQSASDGEKRNYMLATDARVDRAGKGVGFSQIDGVLLEMRRRSGQAVFFYDACRNDPLGEQAPVSVDGMAIRRQALLDGAAAIEVDEKKGADQAGMYIAYATAPNRVADDAYEQDADHSPFTRALLNHIATPGYSLKQVMSYVANDVGELTDWEQTPWTSSSLTTDLRLNGEFGIDEWQDRSEALVLESQVLLASGRRYDALKAALSALPVNKALALDPRFKGARDAAMAAYNSPVNIVKRHEGDITSLELSPDGAAIMSTSSDRTIKLTDYTTGELIDTLEGHRFPVATASFNKDGTKIVSIDIEGNVIVWNRDDGQKVDQIRAPRLRSSAIDVQILRDETVLVLTRLELATIDLNDRISADAQSLGAMFDGKLYEAPTVRSARYIDSDNSYLLVLRLPSSSSDTIETMIVRLSVDGAVLSTIFREKTSFVAEAISPSGSQIAMVHREDEPGDATSQVKINHLTIFDLDHAVKRSSTVSLNPDSMAYSRDGSVIGLATEGAIESVDSRTGQKIGFQEMRSGRTSFRSDQPTARSGLNSRISLVSAGATTGQFAFGSYDLNSSFVGVIQSLHPLLNRHYLPLVWEYQTTDLSAEKLITVVDDAVVVSEITTGMPLHRFELPRESELRQLVLSASGRYIAAAMSDGQVLTADLQSNRHRITSLELAGYAEPDQVSYSSLIILEGGSEPDGLILTSSSIEGSPVQWDFHSGTVQSAGELPFNVSFKFVEARGPEIASFMNAGNEILELVKDASLDEFRVKNRFSPIVAEYSKISTSEFGDLVALSSIKSVRIWKRDSGKLIFSADGDEFVRQLNFDQAGERLAVRDNAHVHVFDIQSGAEMLTYNISGNNSTQSLGLYSGELSPLSFSRSGDKLWVPAPSQGGVLSYVAVPRSYADVLFGLFEILSEPDRKAVSASRGRLWVVDARTRELGLVVR